MENTSKMLQDYGNILDEFINKSSISDIGILHEYLDWVYCECRSNYRFRFMIVKVPCKEYMEYVLVPFKVIDPRTSKIENYFTISYEPIPYFYSDKISNAVSRVLKVLESYHSVKSISIIVDKVEGTAGYMRCNYYNLESQWKEMQRGKWRSSHGINTLSKILDVCYDDCSEKTVEECDILYKKWCDSRKNKLDIGSYGTYMLKTLKMACRDSKVNIITFRYKGILLGFSIGNVVGNKFYFCNECKSIVFDIDDISEGVPEKDIINIQKYLGSFMQYHLHKYAFDVRGVTVLSYYGVLDSNKDLKIFKEKYYKNVCYYERVPLNDFICSHYGGYHE